MFDKSSKNKPGGQAEEPSKDRIEKTAAPRDGVIEIQLFSKNQSRLLPPQKTILDGAIQRALRCIEHSIPEEQRQLKIELCTSFISLNAALKEFSRNRNHDAHRHLTRASEALEILGQTPQGPKLHEILRWLRGCLEAAEDHLHTQQQLLPFTQTALAANFLQQAASHALRLTP